MKVERETERERDREAETERDRDRHRETDRIYVSEQAYQLRRLYSYQINPSLLPSFILSIAEVSYLLLCTYINQLSYLNIVYRRISSDLFRKRIKTFC